MKLSDEWRTPKQLFDKLNEEFKFTADLCATAENKKCAHYCQDYLNSGKLDDNFSRCFMNPPYSRVKPFIEKAWKDSEERLIVLLLKCDPSTSWFSIFWDYEKNEAKKGCEIRFFPKRIKFEKPIGYEGPVTSPAFPNVLVIMDRRHHD